MNSKDEFYKNGQRVFEISDSIKTIFYKSGAVKAKGAFIDSKMEGEWRFYRETGELWQVGMLKRDLKHGRWIRYSKEGNIEYDAEFREGKLVK